MLFRVKIFGWILAITFCINTNAGVLCDSINCSEQKNILQSHYKFQFQNDYNLFTGKSDDRGYTVGGGHFVRIVNYEKIRFYDISVSSKLYTDFIPNSVHYVNTDKVYNQNFVEINNINFSVSNYSNRYSVFYSLGGGIGIKNKEKPIPGFALYAQGGNDGFGGFHQLFFDDIHYNSVNREKIKGFIFIKPTVSKYIVLKNKLWCKNNPFIKFQTGISVGTSHIQSLGFINLHSEVPFVQLNSKKHKVFSLVGCFSVNSQIHSSGILINPETGIKITLYNIELGYSVYKQIGNQQMEVIEFFDDEPIMTLSIQLNFNNKLK